MSFLEKIIDEINQHYEGKTFVHNSDLREYRDRYYTYCLNRLEDKPSGFFGWVSFSNDTTRKFNEAFYKLNIEIIEDEVLSLHDYDLKETGMNRLSELERKLK